MDQSQTPSRQCSPPDQRFRIGTLADIPLPKTLPVEIAGLVRSYLERLSSRELMLDGDLWLQAALIDIDAAVVASYELPVRVERDLLRFFEGIHRPVAHAWVGWTDLDASPGLSLREILSGRRKQFTGNWIATTFARLPRAEADTLRQYFR
jgi:hypothetical protein